ncbi:HAD family hydrolase [Streptomyces viridochromogenes]|uniref:HAD family hydrolase n=2 Tax=Streptomyces viridochromogenes TaxID=1938 RepID=A0A0J8C1H0_STRVR|nr:HAD family hydrolase [Streptomyces viridochromogenes]
MFGVLARVQSTESQEVIERTAGVSGERFWDAYWSLRPPYDRGDVRGPAYWGSVSERLGTPFTDWQVDDLIAADLASWSEIDQESVDFLAELADRGVRLGLLSNIPEELAAHYEATQEWLGHFSVLGLSCRIGSAKPEPAAYTWCSRELGLPAEDILFVDDRSDNVLAAREVGMRGHVFTGVGLLAAALEEEKTG